MMPTILVVDDDDAFRSLVIDILSEGDYRLLEACDGAAALTVLSGQKVDLVLTDQQMPGMTGLELARRALAAADPPSVILMTAFGTIPNAMEAVRLGATDYLTKPLESPAALRSLVSRTLGEHENSTDTGEFLTRDPSTLEMLTIADRAAATDATVLITGESGTGKEVLAHRIHSRSNRSSGPFVAVNCASIPDTLAESEFFGHEKGSFTGADAQRAGRFEQADGGTLFLDEIGELPESMQAKLLRVLEDRTVEKIGGNRPIAVDFRLLAATNRTLEDEVDAGRFRRDLLYRLDVIRLEIAPLSERPSDVGLLAEALIKSVAQRLGLPERNLSPEALEILATHSWPGNVRELRNIIERGLILAQGDTIGPEHLPSFAPTVDVASDQASPLSLADRERQAILEALERAKGHREEAAQLLGISVRTLYNRLKEYNIR
ncbi:MAG: sigma-54 dependent transcriptional regulator [Acidobacteriota bacterium]